MGHGIAGHWEQPPARLTLPEGVLDVWRARLEVPSGWAQGLLSAEELARAGRLVRAQDGARWAASRAILRALLTRYLDVEAPAIAFTFSDRGKPALQQARWRLHFNLSHSEDLSLYAFCRDYEVGVDVEHESRARNPLAVARRIMGEGEELRLRALEPAARRREFVRSWTRHEAIAKCLGMGLARAPADAASLSVIELDVGSDAAGAVATAGSPRQLRQFEWQL